jgi:hypothetical protein
MGRLVGLPHFFSQIALDEEKSDTSSIRKARGSDYEEAALNGDELVECQMSIAHRMQKQFQGRVLRRTIDSKDWEKKTLIPIPPYEEFRLVVKLTEREMDILTALSDDVKDRYVELHKPLQCTMLTVCL